ncbi:MAG: ATP-binding cassette domain-containing protein [Brumimicrobium sp.]|nr:ATP-binding cassette domain-containing protein [Brumimicrobium sp.]
MQISFNDVMPFPLSSIRHGEKSIWGSSFTLKEGQKVVLNASSGKGKTTFTHILSGIRKDFTGNVLFDDEKIKLFDAEKWSDFRKNRVSVIFQDLQLFPHLTVRENLLVKNSLTDTFSESQLLDLLKELDIVDKWEEKCSLLSMGQQQRVAIIRAMSQPFEWLIMDEPFSHLDEGNTQKCLQMIDSRCNELNAGFILTTLGDFHDFNYDRELNL